MKKKLEEFLELEKRATEGPWEVEIIYDDEPGYEEFIKRINILKDYKESKYVITNMNWSNPLVANAQFIAQSRTIAPQAVNKLMGAVELLERVQKDVFFKHFEHPLQADILKFFRLGGFNNEN